MWFVPRLSHCDKCTFSFLFLKGARDLFNDKITTSLSKQHLGVYYIVINPRTRISITLYNVYSRHESM